MDTTNNTTRVVTDVKWAEKNGLVTAVEGNLLQLSGYVSFRAYYNGGQLLTGADIPAIASPELIIEDTWSIKLYYNYRHGAGIPTVFDTSGRIKETAKKRKKQLADMHINTGEHFIMPMPRNSFCVAPRPKLGNTYASGFDLVHYFRQYLIPFLFQQSYYEKYGKWPWPQKNYPHGIVGEHIWHIEHRTRKHKD